jgi:hypothetical protein
LLRSRPGSNEGNSFHRYVLVLSIQQNRREALPMIAKALAVRRRGTDKT